jgi:catechol 2,3-dioxygenase-like lactoylglutathione lyase family enzyme
MSQVPADAVAPPDGAGSVTVDHAVVGASDLARSVSFYTAMGFDILREGRVEADAASALYGLDAATDEVVLGVAGAHGGMLRVVATPLAAPEPADFHRGGHALDVYTTDIHASVSAAQAWGAVTGPIADYPFGPVHLTQAQAYAPDHVPFVFVGIDHRLPSVLDAQPERLHSELHSVVACVDDLDAETAFWTGIVPLEKQSAFPIDVPAVSEFMMLPRHVPVRMSVMRSPGAVPPRFELLEFQGADGPYVAGHPLLPGALIAGLVTDDLDVTIARLAAGGAEVGAVVRTEGLRDGAQRAAWVRTPGGVDVEVRGPAA